MDNICAPLHGEFAISTDIIVFHYRQSMWCKTTWRVWTWSQYLTESTKTMKVRSRAIYIFLLMWADRITHETCITALGYSRLGIFKTTFFCADVTFPYFVLPFADLRGVPGTCAPLGSKFFHFHAVLSNKNRLTYPLWELASPAQQNPRSATVYCCYNLKYTPKF